MEKYRAGASLAVALGVHAALVLLLTWRVHPVTGLAVDMAFEAAEDLAPMPIALMDIAPEMRAPPTSSEPVRVVVGAADLASFGAGHPLPDADVDLPGMAAASRGGGGAGGADTWTGRDDREELRSQSWNDPDRYRLARRRTGAERTSVESIARADEQRWEDRTETRRRRARRGEAQSALAPVGPDPELAAAAISVRVTGAVDPTPRAAHVDPGAAATEAEIDGPTSDDIDSAGASYEREPGAFELTKPRAGGAVDGSGVKGPHSADGVSARGSARRSSTAALRAAVARSAVSSSTRARRQNPYFRKMYSRLDELIEFPRELALSMDQGEVVVRFTLLRDGRVRDVSVEKSSGYEKFDTQVTSAVLRGGPFGKVPKAIIGTRTKITVRAPYAFRNPLIR